MQVRTELELPTISGLCINWQRPTAYSSSSVGSHQGVTCEQVHVSTCPT